MEGFEIIAYRKKDLSQLSASMSKPPHKKDDDLSDGSDTETESEEDEDTVSEYLK